MKSVFIACIVALTVWLVTPRYQLIQISGDEYTQASVWKVDLRTGELSYCEEMREIDILGVADGDSVTQYDAQGNIIHQEKNMYPTTSRKEYGPWCHPELTASDRKRLAEEQQKQKHKR